MIKFQIPAFHYNHHLLSQIQKFQERSERHYQLSHYQIITLSHYHIIELSNQIASTSGTTTTLLNLFSACRFAISLRISDLHLAINWLSRGSFNNNSMRNIFLTRLTTG